MPDVVQMVYDPKNRTYRLHGIEDETTAHIKKFVLEQLDSRKSKLRVIFLFFSFLSIESTNKINFRFLFLFFSIGNQNDHFNVSHLI